MAWTITLEDENKKPIRSLNNEFDFNLIENSGNFKLLIYLDAYGDTIFNRLQMNDLIGDLKLLKITNNNSVLDEIQALAQECKEGEHTYLAFYGE